MLFTASETPHPELGKIVAQAASTCNQPRNSLRGLAMVHLQVPTSRLEYPETAALLSVAHTLVTNKIYTTDIPSMVHYDQSTAE
jgi:formate-dependent phosphoribosylglycinamide formyltransferase (GAR transformylase)